MADSLLSALNPAGTLPLTGAELVYGVQSNLDARLTSAQISATILLQSNTFANQQTVQGLTTTSPGWYAQITGDTFPRVRVGLNATDIPSIAFGPGTGARDTFLERFGVASLRLGAPDAAAPVGQILGVQNVIAGTANTAGPNFTVNLAQGTGTGQGGSLIIKGAAAGGAGSSVNALATVFTLTPAGALTLTGAISGSSFSGSGSGITGLPLNTGVTGILPVANGGTNANSASITAFNNITGYTAAGATGTTSTNLVFSTSPSLTTPVLGVATGTSLALGGATIGSDALGVTGTSTFTGNVTIASASQLLWSTDLIFTRKAAATLHLGAADVDTAPVAQTLGVQGALAGGTANVAGANFTIAGSQGKGTGVGGSLIFQTAPAGSTGTAVNALVTALTINSTGLAIFSSTAGLSTDGSTANLLSISGYTSLRGVSGGNGILLGNASTTVGTAWELIKATSPPQHSLASTLVFGWSSTGDPSLTQDVSVTRRAAASFQHGAADASSPVAQTIGFQGSRAGTDTNVGGANATINPSIGTGNGTPANIIINGIVGATTGTGAHTLAAAVTIAGAVNGQKPSVVLGSAAIATNATDGFLYMVTGAGQPTGTPTAFTGRVAFYYDTTNHQLWIYDGSWLQPKTPGAAAIITWQ